MSDDSARSKQQGLQQAASVIFALVAVVPLLIFAWTLHTLGAIGRTQAQVSLALAVAIALLGYWMFRSMLGRMAEVVQALAAAVEQAHRTRRAAPAVAAAGARPAAAAAPHAGREPAAGSLAPAAPPSAPAAATADVAARPTAAAPHDASHPPANGATKPAARLPAVAPRPDADAGARQARAVPGIGKIRELTEVVRTMDALWHREASAHLGKRVQVSVANSREPLVGTLAEASADGLILEQDDGAVAIAYGRVTAIDRLS